MKPAHPFEALELAGQFVVSPIGPDAETTSASVRAGIMRLTIVDDLYRPLVAGPECEEEPVLALAMVPGLESDITGVDRLLALALRALRGLIERTELARAELPRTGLLVALPEPDQVVASWNLKARFLPAFLARAGIGELPSAEVEIDQSGAVAMFALLRRAAASLAAGTIDQCILLGVDSYVDPHRLRALDEDHRLKGERGVDGFIPGEAAVALLVQRRQRRPGGRPCRLRLLPPQLAVEPNPQSGELSSTGVGLSTVLRGAVAASTAEQTVRWVLCNLNGESYRAFEWGVVQTRLGALFAENMRVVHPAECMGDCGAAAGGLLIACAAEAFRRKYQHDSMATIWTASFGPARGGLLAYPP